MNARQIYRYLFSTINENEVIAINDFFNRLKGDDKFRSILRVLNATMIEKSLYGNNTDELTWISYFSGRDYKKEFRRYNDRYKYLPDSKENIELYRQIYYVCELIQMSQSILHYFYSDNVEFYAYQMMVYFGLHNDGETILNEFDQYCNHTNNLSKELSEIFPKKLRALESSIQLLAWQKMIALNHSSDAIALLYIASEIEQVLGHAPNDINEAIKSYEDLLNENKLRHKELVEFLSQFPSEQFQLIFIKSLNENNLHGFIPHRLEFCNILQLINDPSRQTMLLDRINDEKIQLLATDEYHCEAILKSAHIQNVPLLIKKIGNDVLLKNVQTAWDLNYFMEMRLPKSYDKSCFLLTDLSQEKIQSFINCQFDMNILLKSVYYTERLKFLLNIVGKDKCALCVKSANHLCDILDKLRREDRFTFIKAVLTDEDLKIMSKEINAWKEVKSKLEKTDKQSLNELIFSKEDLIAKDTLKNIKHTMQRTKWSFGMFESSITTRLGKRYVEVPSYGPVRKQIDQLHDLSWGRKSPTEALDAIKQIGKEAAASSQTWTATAKNLFFVKPETQKYIDNFVDEEAFQKAFKKK